MVETPTTAACRTERRGYGRQLRNKLCSGDAGRKSRVQSRSGRGRGRDGARDAIVRTIEATRKEIGGGSSHSNRSRSERSVAIARLEAADYVTAATSSAPRIGFFNRISRIDSHLLEAVEGGDGGDSLLGGNLNGGLGGDGGAEEGGGHGGHFI